MGLSLEGLLSAAARGAFNLVELGFEIFDRGPAKPIVNTQSLVDEGPDDLFPLGDDYVRARISIDVPSPSMSAPETVVDHQWGLVLPNGDIHWNAWQGVHFGHPIDRTQMVATLQKTAADIGLAEGEQTDQFLARYRWVTRYQHATVVYEQAGAYPLTDPQVFALGAPDVGERPHDDNPSNPSVPSHNGIDPGLDVRPGPVGGDAQ